MANTASGLAALRVPVRLRGWKRLEIDDSPSRNRPGSGLPKEPETRLTLRHPGAAKGTVSTRGKNSCGLRVSPTIKITDRRPDADVMRPTSVGCP